MVFVFILSDPETTCLPFSSLANYNVMHVTDQNTLERYRIKICEFVLLCVSQDGVAAR